MRELIPDDWAEVLAEDLASEWFAELEHFVAAERQAQAVCPPRELTFHALERTPYAAVRVLLLGQDPYHGPGQAHGLCFSVPRGVPFPPSLRNIFKERENDLGLALPDHGCLVPWADRGVLLLNTVLTVRAGEANSHKGRGWERFTDTVIEALSARPDPVVFVLWGGAAQKKRKLIDTERNAVVENLHPSPLSAWRGWFGSHAFRGIDEALTEQGLKPMDWSLPPATDLGPECNPSGE